MELAIMALVGHAAGHRPPAHTEPGGHAVCWRLATAALAHEKPASQPFVLSAVLPSARHAPAAHAEQNDAPVELLKKPAGQSVGVAEPAGQNEPALQGVHAEEEDAPVTALDVPDGHGVGAPMAAVGQYAPSVHVEHAVAPAAAKVPAAHCTGSADPVGQWYPAGQTRCESPPAMSGQKKPAVHCAVKSAEQPGWRQEPRVHAVHTAAPVPLKKPAGHAMPLVASVVLAAVCVGLTEYVPTPPFVPDKKLAMYVPITTAEPEKDEPTKMVPDATAVTVRVVPEIEPVNADDPEPRGQYEPAWHAVPAGVVAPRAHVVPALQGFALTAVLPVEVQKPALHAPVHALEERLRLAPKTPAGHGFAVAELVCRGQK